MPAKLKHGVIGAKGGKREGAGRTPDWLKEKCQKIIDKSKVIDFLAKVVQGHDMEQVVGNEGEVIQVPASVRDRIKAAEILLERGFGKAQQTTDLTSGGKGLIEILREFRDFA